MTNHEIQPRRRAVSARVAAAVGLVVLTACSSLLDVDNPNNVSSTALDNPVAAPAIVAGAENISANALSSLLNAVVPGSDETYWVGSRDDYRLLDNGGFDAVANEYVQSGYIILSQARWMSNQAITKVKGFDDAGDLLDQQLLVRAYVNAAVIYMAIGDNYNDVAFSDRTVAGPNLGEANMAQVYDSALTYLNAAVPLATGNNRAITLALRARARHARAVWVKLNSPKGTAPANGLIADAAMLADATAALGFMTGDWRYDALTNDQNQGDGSGGGFGFEMNSRVEYTLSQTLATIDPNSGKPTGIIAQDPVTAAVDAAAVVNIDRVINSAQPNSPPIGVTSAREMWLLIAEHQLASASNANFDAAINSLRAMDSKAAYNGTGPTRLALLQWERRINLIFMARRLQDMYRFGIVDPSWIGTNIAVRKPGCFFPIPQIEIDANQLLSGVTSCT